MEKIVIFIIIMIVSSYFSKKKRKRANFTSTKKTDTTFFDKKGNKVSESRYKTSSKPTVNSTQQPHSISEALSELKNIFTNTPQQKPEPEPVYETSFTEVSTEANDANYSEEGYREEQIKYETQNTAPTVKNTVKEKNDGFRPMDETSYVIKTKKIVQRKDVFTNLFNTKNQLKKAVIINEVFNKKY